MKKILAKIIMKTLYIILKIFRFPKTQKKENEEFSRINQIYSSKETKKINNKFIIDSKVDLTFIVPVYNAEKFISRCLDSLLNQKTEYNYNIICINDGSNDESLKLLKEYEEKNTIIKVFNQRNSGIAETRNFGINHITGKYISFVDIDDFITNDFVQKLLKCSYENDADIVRCNYYEYNSEQELVIKTGKNKENKVINGHIGREILNYKGYPWGGVFKSELWKNIQFPNGFWYEDMIIRMILFRKAKKFAYINDKLYFYCIHKNNISKTIEKTSNTKCLDQYYLVKQLVKLSEDIDLQMDESLYCDIMYEYGVVLWLRTRGIDKKLRKRVFIDACEFINSIDFKYCFNKEETIVHKIFDKQDYIMWNIYAIYKMLGVKYGGE